MKQGPQIEGRINIDNKRGIERGVGDAGSSLRIASGISRRGGRVDAAQIAYLPRRLREQGGRLHAGAVSYTKYQRVAFMAKDLTGPLKPSTRCPHPSDIV